MLYAHKASQWTLVQVPSFDPGLCYVTPHERNAVEDADLCCRKRSNTLQLCRSLVTTGNTIEPSNPPSRKMEAFEVGQIFQMWWEGNYVLS
jgi:hypothetical protein